jgi:hypothetical protein
MVGKGDVAGFKVDEPKRPSRFLLVRGQLLSEFPWQAFAPITPGMRPLDFTPTRPSTRHPQLVLAQIEKRCAAASN